MSTYEPVLDRRIPGDWKHVSKYRLTASPVAVEDLPPLPVIMGTNWYRWMSNPVYDASDNRYWIGRGLQPDRWGVALGGHAYVLKPSSVRDYTSWWDWYDQGEEGKCVGFASARAMTLIDRVRVDPHGIYHAAQAIDEWPETPPEEGTSVRAAIDVLRTVGAAPVRGGKVGVTTLKHGVSANRWAVSVEEVYSVLKSPYLERQGVVALLNSWGRYYSHITYVQAEHFVRLLDEWGEATMFVPA